jgi:hypothetical protein
MYPQAYTRNVTDIGRHHWGLEAYWGDEHILMEEIMTDIHSYSLHNALVSLN